MQWHLCRSSKAAASTFEGILGIKFLANEDELLWERYGKVGVLRNSFPIGSMYGIYANIGGIHQYTPNVSIYTIHGSYGFEYF